MVNVSCVLCFKLLDDAIFSIQYRLCRETRDKKIVRDILKVSRHCLTVTVSSPHS